MGELYENLPTRDLLLRGGMAFVVALAAWGFSLGIEAFAALYALQIGMGMWISGTIMILADQPPKDRRALAPWFVMIMLVAWTLLVVLPFTGVWLAPGQPLFPAGVRTLMHLPWGELALPSLVLAGFASARGVAYWRAVHAAPGAPRPDLKKALMHRVVCVAVFLFFGPGILAVVQSGGVVWPPLANPSNAIVVTYALCEAYPFIAPVIDRVGARRAGRSGRA